MKLKTEKPFNFKLVQELLIKEDKFITDVFSKMDLPVTNDLDDEENSENETSQKNNDGKTLSDRKDKKTKRAQTFEELHSRLNELKGKKKLGYKQKLVKKGLKNRIQKKTKREERLMQKKLAKAERLAGGASKIREGADSAHVYQQKPIFNEQGNMVFSKFDFSDDVSSKKRGRNDKDPKKILQRIEQKQKKIKDLEEQGDTEKAEEIKDKEVWKSALAKASGEKVKDDPDLLKKTIKREEQKKKHSAKKWEARNEKVQKSQQERQNKRQENILKRKKDKKTNKLKKASKKGRVIPGF